MVVIGILAAIVTVAYNGITNQARGSSLQADLRTNANQLEIGYQTNGGYPANEAAVNGGQGLKASGNNTLSYSLRSYGYCIQASNTQSPISYALRSNNGKVVPGSCESTVTTLAGSGSPGSTNATGTAAQFYYPYDAVADAAGNVYVSDCQNNLVRKITSAGVVSTLAGSGTAGHADNTGTAAQFTCPSGIAVDSAGIVYVADTDRVRKISPAGVVTTLAASGLSNIKGIAIDTAGTLYVANNGLNRISKISPAGVVSTFAGGTQGFAEGNGAAARFTLPQDVAVDSQGVVYVADTGNYRIRKITPSGDVSTFIGNSTQGCTTGSSASTLLWNSWSVAVDKNNYVYFTDMGCSNIRQVAPDGTATVMAGPADYDYGNTNGLGPEARFNDPAGISTDGNGTFYVVDYSNHAVRKIVQ